MAATILLVEDNADQAFLIARELRACGFEVITAYSAHGGLDQLAKGAVDCVVLDYRLPDIDGVDGLANICSVQPDLPQDLGFLAKLRTDYPCLPVGVISAHGTDQVAAEALQRLGARFYLSKHGREYLPELARHISGVLRRAVFRKQGNQWCVAWNGAEAWFIDRIGFQLIPLLLARPGEVFASSELWAAVSYNPDATCGRGPHSADLPSWRGGNALAPRTAHNEEFQPQVRALDEKIRELQTELDAAGKDNDLGKRDKLRDELERVRELRHSCTRREREANRQGDHHDEKTRLSVRKNIKAAIDDIRTRVPNLADYLTIYIKTGYDCMYVRDLERPVPWVL